MLLKRALLLATLPVVLFSCVKKDDPTIVDPPPARKDVHLYFDNFAGNDALKLNSTTYTNEWGETFTVSMFNYYISNIKLNGPSGTYTESESYHLIREGIEGSMHLHLEEVPAGTYNSITFTIGVDSARNVDGAQSGALAKENGMFWDWNTGYIMAKLEGKADASTKDDKSFRYHTGGFKGTNNVLRTITLNLPNNASVTSDKTAEIQIKADLLKWFTPNMISFAAVNSIMSEGPTAAKIADNYSKMFSVTEVKSVNE